MRVKKCFKYDFMVFERRKVTQIKLSMYKNGKNVKF